MTDIRPITVKAAAARLGTTERAVRGMIVRRELPGYRFEGSRFVRLDAGEVEAKLLPARLAAPTVGR
jgi:excisionase family DNA binding protein